MPKPQPTTITVYPGIQLVVQPDVTGHAKAALEAKLAELGEFLIVERIAHNLGERDDRYEIAELLRKEPLRLTRIAAILHEARL